ncbi:hypothetical protein RHSIM_Rhsim01G0293200 [Rhododendron simsii]|uniref:J domain-containing protein n=1 Tax=Rhododendron simsii TaxID=118357 RepID=A0A834HGZ1_RHOSS|nr:hypothetical protein RHSIM_Rhsim01G0293200 [Rhododendron simsii]
MESPTKRQLHHHSSADYSGSSTSSLSQSNPAAWAYLARFLLRQPSPPSPPLVKAAYRKKVWDSHPDLFPGHEKCYAESKFKLISEAYTCLQSCLLKGFHMIRGFEEEKFRGWKPLSWYVEYFEVRNIRMHMSLKGSELANHDRSADDLLTSFKRLFKRRRCRCSGTIVVRTGVASVHGGRRNHALIGVPFIFIILGTVALGGLNATRAYKKQKETYPSHNPFLP